MFGNKKVDEKFLKASKEHVIIYQHIETFQKIIAAKNKDGLFHALKESLEAFEKDMQAHFELEESVLFPAALTCIASLETCDQVLKFQKEHGYFEKDLESIRQQMHHLIDEERDVTEEALNGLADLLKGFKTHALAESNLYSQMDAEKACQRLLKGIAIPA